MNELKPCPFCGGKASLKVEKCISMVIPEGVKKCEIKCNNCGVYMRREEKEDSVISVWNNRYKVPDSLEYFSDINKAISSMIPVIDCMSEQHNVTKHEAASALLDFFGAMVRANYTDRE